MVALGLVLSRTLPYRKPEARMSYGALIGSMARLVARTPILRLRTFYQSCLFAAFSLFCTTMPLLLADHDYRLTQRGIALFALAGVSGAVTAPIAGRLADRGFSRQATLAAILIVAAGFLATMVVSQGSGLALAVLVVAGIAIDFGVQANVVLGLRAIFALAPEARGRLNGVYIATFFIGGALGSAVGAWAYARGGWPAREPHRPRASADCPGALPLPAGDGVSLEERTPPGGRRPAQTSGRPGRSWRDRGVPRFRFLCRPDRDPCRSGFCPGSIQRPNPGSSPPRARSLRQPLRPCRARPCRSACGLLRPLRHLSC
jgi:Major Facilitator Superfamily